MLDVEVALNNQPLSYVEEDVQLPVLTSRTLLDVILVNNDNRITDSGIVPVPLSDHYLVYCVLIAGEIKAPPKTIEYCS